MIKNINNYDDLNNYIKQIKEEYEKEYNECFCVEQTKEEEQLQQILLARYGYKLQELDQLQDQIDYEEEDTIAYKKLKEKIKLKQKDIANSFIWIRLANNELMINSKGEQVKKGFDKPFNIRLIEPLQKDICPLWYILSRLSKLNFNTYITPAIFSLGKGEDHFRRKQINAKSIQSIILDFDYKTQEEKALFNKLKNNQEKLIEHFTKTKGTINPRTLIPNRIMCSGRGFQVEYFLDKPFYLTQKGQDMYKDFIKSIIAKQGSDNACSDCSRYFRLDFSLNVKEEIIPTTTYYLDFKNKHSITKLDSILGECVVIDKNYKREIENLNKNKQLNKLIKR